MMLTKIWSRIGLAVVLCLVAVPLVSAGTGSTTWVRVKPASGDYGWGELIDVEVWIEDVQEMYAGDVQLTFDPQVLAVVDANPATTAIEMVPRNDLLSPDWVIRNVADNQAGTTWYAVSQLNPSPAVSGSGAFFSFQFKTKGVGKTEVVVHYRKLASRDGIEIPAEAAGASYRVTGEFNSIFLPLVSKNQ